MMLFKYYLWLPLYNLQCFLNRVSAPTKNDLIYLFVFETPSLDFYSSSSEYSLPRADLDTAARQQNGVHMCSQHPAPGTGLQHRREPSGFSEANYHLVSELMGKRKTDKN